MSPRGPKRYLWYLKGKTLAEMTNEEKRNIITEIDVTYGDDVAWYGFERLTPSIADKDAAKKLETVSLTIRRGVKRTSIFRPFGLVCSYLPYFYSPSQGRSSPFLP